jgi:putative endonuclease
MEYLSNNFIGQLGEALAAKYLSQHGYTIITQNYTIPGLGEIDIIAYNKGTFHFVEVKSSHSSTINSEYHSSRHFDDRKKARIARVMRKYCSINDISSPRTVSLCVVSFSRETHAAYVSFEPYILLDTV